MGSLVYFFHPSIIALQVVQTEESVFTTKAEANIQYIKSELEALTDGGGLQEITLDPIQVHIWKIALGSELQLSCWQIALGESGVSESQDIQVMDQVKWIPLLSLHAIVSGKWYIFSR